MISSDQEHKSSLIDLIAEATQNVLTPAKEPEETAPDVVHLTIFYSALNQENRTDTELYWFAEKTIADYMEGLPPRHNWTVGHNGGVVLKHLWDKTALEAGDTLVVTLMPEGGGGAGKLIMRIVAMIGIAVLSYFTGGAAAAAYGPLAGAAAGAAVSVVGGILVNTLIPPPKPKEAKTQEDSPSYGVDGPKNTSSEDVPVAVVMGEFRVGGNITNLRVDNDGDTQILYAQYAVSEGPIEGISSIVVNDQDVTYYEDVDYRYRLGVDNQDIVAWFDDSYTNFSKGAKLTTDWLEYTTQGVVDKFRVNIAWPGGLFRIKETTGKRKSSSTGLQIEYKLHTDTIWQPYGNGGFVPFSTSHSVSGLTQRIRVTGTVITRGQTPSEKYACQMYYRKVGTTAWTSMGSYSGTIKNRLQKIGGRDGEFVPAPTSINFTFEADNLPYESYEVTSSGLASYSGMEWGDKPTVISTSTRNPMRRAFESVLLPQGIYDIRVRRTEPESTEDTEQNSCQWDTTDEIIADNVAYNFTAFYALKIRFTDQLNGVPTVSALVKGIKCPIYNMAGEQIDFRWTNNPAWLTAAALCNARWGGGLDPSRLDWARWVEWAEFCEANDLVFNGIFDTASNVWDAIQNITRIGRALVVPAGTKYSVAIERPDQAVMMFSVANIVKDSFGLEWSSQTDRANEIEVTYYDKEDGYKRKTIRVVDYEALRRGMPQRTVSVTLLGIDNADQAYREGWLQLMQNRYVLQSCSFDAPLQAIACRVGSVVYVQHDVPEWGDAGMIAAGSTDTVINLDRPVTMNAAKTYMLLVHHSAVKIYTFQVTTVVGMSVYIPTPAGTFQPVTRLIKAGRDIDIVGYEVATPFTELVLDDATGISAGDTVELWATDVIEERYVVLDIGDQQTVTVTQGFSQAPVELTQFMFGEATKLKKPFRVRSIEGSHEYTRSLKMLEYNDSIYADPDTAAPTPNYSALPLKVAPVVNMAVSEHIVSTINGIKDRLEVSWEIAPDSAYSGAEIWVSTDGGPYAPMGDAGGGATSWEGDFDDDDELIIKIRPYDSVGNKLRLEETDGLAYTVKGKLAPPSNVTNFKATSFTGPIEFAWDSVTDADLRGYEIREGSSWDSGTVVVTNYKGNRFAYLKNEGGVFQFWIAAQDTSLKYSETPITVAVQVFGPAAVAGFDCVSNNNAIIFTWLPNTDQAIDSYEIREGASWANSTLLNRAAGTSYMVPVNSSSSRTFWIKAINTLGIYGMTAAFTTPTLAELPDHNVVANFEQDPSWSGKKLNVSVADSKLLQDLGKPYGEYIFDVDLGATFLARNQVQTSFESVVTSTETWSDAQYAWNSSKANKPWVLRGDVNNITVQGQISTFTGALQTGEYETWSLDGTLTGVNGATPSESVGATYTAARFDNGLLRTDTTQVSYGVTLGSTFFTTNWVKIANTGGAKTVLRLKNGTAYLRVDVDAAGGVVSLIGSDGNTISITGLTLPLNELIFIGINQNATRRDLYVGIFDSTVTLDASGDYAPISSWTAVSLY